VPERLHLIFDADDTLWENNIYFERAFDEFVDYLDHSKLSAVEVRAILDEIEAANAKIHGYGSLNFARNLEQVYQHLAERHIAADDLERVRGFALRILEAPMELMPGVAEALEYLAPRHDLTVFTKGHADEQRMKLERSGLTSYFRHCEIVKEKDAAAYRQLVAAHGWAPERTWMIGNSPRSDINPSLAIGLNAVYVPHERTWILEKEEIRVPGPGRLLRVESLRDLREFF
jgi:putative hydrolase of the HAD superfamily